MTILLWTKKLFGLKKSGVLDKEYKILNKINYKKVLEDAFAETNICYLTLTFKKINYTIETLIWRDEIDYIKKVITFPSTYKIINQNTRTGHLNLNVYKMPDDLKRVYKNLSEQDFIEYIKKVLQGY